MNKHILITGATDGIGFETAKLFAEKDYNLLIHGRNETKLEHVKEELTKINPTITIDTIKADLSILSQVVEMAHYVTNSYSKIDVLLNNAGVFVANQTVTVDGLELRFSVNTIAPYLLTKLLIPVMNKTSRVVNLSSAAQAPLDMDLLLTGTPMPHNDAYAQSKLALTMWSMELGKLWYSNDKMPAMIAVNPKSFLGSKMVKTAYGTAGHDLRIGADVLYRASVSEEFSNASGKYFDNDMGKFQNPHPDAMNEAKCVNLIRVMDSYLEEHNFN